MGNENESVKSYISSCGYTVYFNHAELGFSKVSGLSAELESETYQEGGRGALPYIMKKKDAGNKVLTLEKGISKKENYDLYQLTKPGIHINDLIICVKKDKQPVDKAFFFEDALITKVSYSNLDALEGGVLSVTLEISHSGLVEIADIGG